RPKVVVMFCVDDAPKAVSAYRSPPLRSKRGDRGRYGRPNGCALSKIGAFTQTPRFFACSGQRAAFSYPTDGDLMVAVSGGAYPFGLDGVDKGGWRGGSQSCEAPFA